MKFLVKSQRELEATGRWDVDYHLPPKHLENFDKDLLSRIDQVAVISKDKRNPTRKPDKLFTYIDISSIDVISGVIVTPQELTGAEAPSRARKVVRAFDILISTCRPTRGAIAVVPQNLHNQIASTGFEVIRPNSNVNPYYLHFALRQESTLEQFRKWSTGSSYPAILDDDIAKTLVPMPITVDQDRLASKIVKSTIERNWKLQFANAEWKKTLDQVYNELSSQKICPKNSPLSVKKDCMWPCTIAEIQSIIDDMQEIEKDESGRRVKICSTSK